MFSFTIELIYKGSGIPPLPLSSLPTNPSLQLWGVFLCGEQIFIPRSLHNKIGNHYRKSLSLCMHHVYVPSHSIPRLDKVVKSQDTRGCQDPQDLNMAHLWHIRRETWILVVSTSLKMFILRFSLNLLIRSMKVLNFLRSCNRICNCKTLTQIRRIESEYGSSFFFLFSFFLFLDCTWILFTSSMTGAKTSTFVCGSFLGATESILYPLGNKMLKPIKSSWWPSNINFTNDITFKVSILFTCINKRGYW